MQCDVFFIIYFFLYFHFSLLGLAAKARRESWPRELQSYGLTVLQSYSPTVSHATSDSFVLETATCSCS